MNILILYHRDIHINDSGASRVIITKSNYLADKKNVNIYTTYHHLSPVNKKIKEIKLNALTVESIKKNILKYNIDILDIPTGESLARLGREAVKDTNCKIITEFHTMPGYNLLRIYDDLILSFKEEKVFFKIKPFIKFIFYPLYYWYKSKKQLKYFQDNYYCSDCLVVLSYSFINQYKEIYKLTDVSKMKVIPNPLSFSQSFNINELNLKENLILIVSRLEETSKRLSLAIKAWSRIESLYPEWELLIVGTGNSLNYYKRLVKQNLLKKVLFIGQTNPEKYYMRASIFLMTSAFEGWGLTLTEAQQKGCVPIVMDSFSTVHDIICDEETGFIIPNNNMDMFVDKMIYLIENKNIRMNMAKKSIQSCQKFSPNEVGEKWYSLMINIAK